MYVLENKKTNFAVLGQGIAYNLGVSITNYSMPLKLYVPKKKKVASLNPMDAFSTRNIVSAGIFQISADIDMKYVLVSKRFAQSLLESKNKTQTMCDFQNAWKKNVR